MGLYQQTAYMIFPFVDGEAHTRLSPDQRRQITQLAARLNAITAYFRPVATPHRWNYNRDLVQRLSQQAAADQPTATAQAKLRWYAVQRQQLQLPPTLPHGICHCDFDPSNVLFKDNAIAALLDFDDANYTYLAFDLASLIDGFAWEFGADFDMEAAQHIATAYQAVRPLSLLEKQHIYDLHKLSILIDGIWFFRRGTATAWYEKVKIAHLEAIGREAYQAALVG